LDADHARVLRELLGGTDWVRGTAGFARALRAAPHQAGGFLLVGTPTCEPWHLSAHLTEEARDAGIDELRPTLVRHVVPAGAPAHLAVDLTRLAGARRGETVLVVAPDSPGDGLLTRLDDARRTGVTLFSLERGDSELGGLAHEQLIVSPSGSPIGAPVPDGVLVPDGLVVAAEVEAAFSVAQHLISLAVADAPGLVGPRGWRGALARFLDTVSGPARSPGSS
jgi:hypothetical protein